ncbi:hypothetical protein CPB85DRAFT_1222023, partial [Mucidula mucida]
AKTDICLVDYDQNHRILLVVREDKRVEGGDPASAQVRIVAAAVGAFTENNRRRMAAGLEPLLDTVVMPPSVMGGTSPTFLKIPVTESLSTHIRDGTYPPDITCVTFCKPPVPRPALWKSEGMKPLDSRRPILSCFEAFKTVVWEYDFFSCRCIIGTSFQRSAQ